MDLLSFYNVIKLPPEFDDWTILTSSQVEADQQISSVHQSGFNSLSPSFLKTMHFLHYKIGRDFFIELSKIVGIKIDFYTVSVSQFLYRSFLNLYSGEKLNITLDILQNGRSSIFFETDFVQQLVFYLLGGRVDQYTEHPLDDIDFSIIQHGIDTFFDHIVSAWNFAFSKDDIESQIFYGETSQDKALSDREAYVMFTYKISFASHSPTYIHLGYPAEMLQSLFDLMVQKSIAQVPTVFLSPDTLSNLLVEAKGIFTELSLPLQSLTQLAVGDVIRLKKPFEKLSSLKLCNQVSVPAQLGYLNGAIALQTIGNDRQLSYEIQVRDSDVPFKNKTKFSKDSQETLESDMGPLEEDFDDSDLFKDNLSDLEFPLVKQVKPNLDIGLEQLVNSVDEAAYFQQSDHKEELTNFDDDQLLDVDLSEEPAEALQEIFGEDFETNDLEEEVESTELELEEQEKEIDFSSFEIEENNQDQIDEEAVEDEDLETYDLEEEVENTELEVEEREKEIDFSSFEIEESNQDQIDEEAVENEDLETYDLEEDVKSTELEVEEQEKEIDFSSSEIEKSNQDQIDEEAVENEDLETYDLEEEVENTELEVEEQEKEIDFSSSEIEESYQDQIDEEVVEDEDLETYYLEEEVESTELEFEEHEKEIDFSSLEIDESNQDQIDEEVVEDEDLETYDLEEEVESIELEVEEQEKEIDFPSLEIEEGNQDQIDEEAVEDEDLETYDLEEEVESQENEIGFARPEIQLGNEEKKDPETVEYGQLTNGFDSKKNNDFNKNYDIIDDKELNINTTGDKLSTNNSVKKTLEEDVFDEFDNDDFYWDDFDDMLENNEKVDGR